MSSALNFGALPPEVNSGLMYAGAGVGPLVAAATAWSNLAGELGAAADACAEVLSGLTGAGWHGPAAASMAAAAAPYAAWMRTTAGQAAQAASQASAAAGAYEAAFAATVPPPVVAENRVRWMSLMATNVFGQNTPAIAATDAAYAEMWAQDAAAMYRYAGDAAAAAVLKPLTAPPATTTPTAQAGEAAATGHAAASAAASTPANASQLLTALQNTLQGLGLNIFDPGSGNSSLGLDEIFNMISGANGASPLANLLNSTVFNSVNAGAPWSPAFIGQAIGDMTALTTVLGRTMGAASMAGLSSATTGAVAPAAGGLSGMGTLAGVHAEAAAGLGGQVGGSAATASVGKATLVRSLSVPPGWTALTAPTEAIAAPVAVAAAPLPTASPVITAGIPAAASTASRMVDKAEDEEVDPPVYGMPTKALARTPVGG